MLTHDDDDKDDKDEEEEEEEEEEKDEEDNAIITRHNKGQGSVGNTSPPLGKWSGPSTRTILRSQEEKKSKRSIMKGTRIACLTRGSNDKGPFDEGGGQNPKPSPQINIQRTGQYHESANLAGGITEGDSY